jgi:uncharacterized protein YndB with AHSA1/START domain
MVIQRPTEEVFLFIGDGENFSKWSTRGTQSVKTTQGPTGAGTSYRLSGKFMGRKLEGTRTITEYRPYDSIRFEQNTPIVFAGQYNFEPIEGGTRLTFAVEAEVTGFYGLIWPIFERTSRRVFEEDLRKLKSVLEARPVTTETP